MDLPLALYSAAQVRRIEQAAIAAGVPGYTLMKRAAAAAAQLLQQRWPQARAVAIVCGGGNNGGDGLALARILRQKGVGVQVITLQDPATLTGEAADAWADLADSAVEVARFGSGVAARHLQSADVVVDALLGIGVRAPLRAPYEEAIGLINACGHPVLSLDLPSGLDPDTGAAQSAVRAAATLSFLALKQGLFMDAGPRCRGELHLDALGVEEIAGRETAAMRRLTHADLLGALPPRARTAHKGMSGRVLIVGGGAGMAGAVRLAGEAALRVGAGLVTVASLAAHETAVIGARPELMFRGIDDPRDVEPLLSACDVIAIGPGLGTAEWGRAVLGIVLAGRTSQGLVIDADALNLLPALALQKRFENAVLTPHPGEAARLLGGTASAVQADRPAALTALLEKWGGVMVLKGAGTLIGSAGEIPRLCEGGNPGMAVPGMGDVLAGTIAGVLAQHRQPHEAASAGVWLHAAAGDRCARSGERGILALEVAAQLRTVLAGAP